MEYSSLLKEILSLLPGLFSKLNGMMWTMVIAGKAGEAILVMQPFRIFSMTALDIAYRTDVGTDATLHALVFLHMKPLVGDEYLFEETAHNLGEEPGDRTFYQTVHALFSVEYLFADNRQFLCRFRFLTNFALLRINIHERKSHIRFRHDE